MIMTKDKVVKAPVDLKQFFEASISALQAEGKASKTGHANGRNRQLIQRTNIGGYPSTRALADATRTLAAMWRLKPQKGI
jgi:hypothetical protein